MTSIHASAIYFSENDAEIIQILQEQGVLHKMMPAPPFTESHHGFQYKGCWCLATCHVRHSEEKDNGYTLACLPMDCFSHREASEFFAMLILECQIKEAVKLDFKEYELCPVMNQ